MKQECLNTTSADGSLLRGCCRTLMCRATNSSPELLADREVALLVAVDWEVHAILRQGGLVH